MCEENCISDESRGKGQRGQFGDWKAMTPDHINFRLTDEVSIGIGQDRQVMLLVDKWHSITETNFGKFLLETQGWGPAQTPHLFRWHETDGIIQ
jgi:hypothetical protein